MFYFERILERISKSKYRNHIILKGGLLLTSIIGNDDRTTKDMDTTFKGYSLNMQEVEKIFKDIFNININDSVTFEIISIKKIRLESNYNGYRLNVLSKFAKNKTYITIEITTGDIITPKEIKYHYKCFFQDLTIPIMSYSIETIIAEKLHAIIVHGVLTTRLKDYYDMYILIKSNIVTFNKQTLIMAIKNTFRNRNTKIDIKEFKTIVEELQEDKHIQKLWKDYQNKSPYAQGIKYEKTVKAIEEVITILEKEKVTL